MKKLLASPVNFGFIIINTIIYLLVYFESPYIVGEYFALHKSNILGFREMIISYFHPIQLFTYSFTNNLFWVYLLNTWALYGFGAFLEQVLGSKRYVAFYFFCAVFAGIILTLLDPKDDPITGGGGVLMSMVAGFTYLLPNEELTFLIPIPIKLKSKYWVVILGGLSAVASAYYYYSPIDSLFYSFMHFGNIPAIISAYLFFKIMKIAPIPVRTIADEMDTLIDEIGKKETDNKEKNED